MTEFSRLVMTGLALLGTAATPPGRPLVIADFNSGQKPDNLGGDFGCWIADPNDPSQGCLEAFDGGALRMIYSVDSSKPAFGGLWFKLQNASASPYTSLALRVRGDPKMGFTTHFKLELKDANDVASKAEVDGVTGEWRDMVIPLAKFEDMANLKRLKELVVTVEDKSATAKRGMLFFDDLRFLP